MANPSPLPRALIISTVSSSHPRICGCPVNNPCSNLLPAILNSLLFAPRLVGDLPFLLNLFNLSRSPLDLWEDMIRVARDTR